MTPYGPGVSLVADTSAWVRQRDDALPRAGTQRSMPDSS